MMEFILWVIFTKTVSQVVISKKIVIIEKDFEYYCDYYYYFDYCDCYCDYYYDYYCYYYCDYWKRLW